MPPLIVFCRYRPLLWCAPICRPNARVAIAMNPAKKRKKIRSPNRMTATGAVRGENNVRKAIPTFVWWPRRFHRRRSPVDSKRACGVGIRLFDLCRERGDVCHGERRRDPCRGTPFGVARPHRLPSDSGSAGRKTDARPLCVSDERSRRVGRILFGGGAHQSQQGLEGAAFWLV